MDYFNSHILVMAACAVLILSHLFGGLGRKTNIPTVLLLIGLGVGIEQFLEAIHVDTTGQIFQVLEIVGLVGLIMIVLEAALDLKLTREKRSLIIRAFVVALVGLLVSTFAIAYLLHATIALDPFRAFLFAIPLSVLSSAIVIPSVRSLVEEKREFLVYESTISDILGILLFNITLGMADGGSAVSLSLEVMINLGASTLLGFVISFVLIFILQSMGKGAKLFFLISLLVLLYAAGKMLHLAALVFILIFGLVLNNVDVFFRGRLKRFARREVLAEVIDHFYVVTRESAFVVRTFFFVIFGMSLDLQSLLSLNVAMISLGILLVVYVLRFGTLKATGLKDVLAESLIAPRGLVSVLLFFSIPAEFSTPIFEPGILLFVILGTGIVMSAGLVLSRRKGVHAQSLTFTDWDTLDREIARLEELRQDRTPPAKP